MFGLLLTALYLVVPAAEADGVKEAIGRCWAEDINESYPAWGTTPFWQDYEFDNNATFDGPGDQAAFPFDAQVDACGGRTFVTDVAGEVTIPSEPTELEEDWFWFYTLNCVILQWC